MGDKLWNMANLLTGCSVAQNLAFLYALAKDLSTLQSQVLRVKVTISIFCVIFGGIYSFAVYRCMKLALTLAADNISIWQEVTFGRLAAIWVFTTLGVFGLLAPDIFGA